MLASKLSRLRQGIPPYKVIELSGGVKVAVVIVPSDAIRQCEERVQQWETDNPGMVNANVRNQRFDAELCFNCMRDPEDLNVKLAENVDEIGQYLDLEDIRRVTNAYGELMMNKAPKIELLKEEELEELKKYLEKTPLKDLSTVSLVHLANFHQSVVSEK